MASIATALKTQLKRLTARSARARRLTSVPKSPPLALPSSTPRETSPLQTTTTPATSYELAQQAAMSLAGLLTRRAPGVQAGETSRAAQVQEAKWHGDPPTRDSQGRQRGQGIYMDFLVDMTGSGAFNPSQIYFPFLGQPRRSPDDPLQNFEFRNALIRAFDQQIRQQILNSPLVPVFNWRNYSSVLTPKLAARQAQAGQLRKSFYISAGPGGEAYRFIIRVGWDAFYSTYISRDTHPLMKARHVQRAREAGTTLHWAARLEPQIKSTLYNTIQGLTQSLGLALPPPIIRSV